MGKLLGTQLRFALVMAAGAVVAWLAFGAAALAIERAHAPNGALAGLRDPISIVSAIDRRPVGQVHQISAKERIAAREVLRREPLFPAALWLLQGQDPGSIKGDRSLLLLSDRLTRRDLPTEFNLMQSYAVSGDAMKLLKHVDHAASTIESGGEPLINQIALGLDNPELSDALLDYAGRPWIGKVLVAAFAKGPAPESVADFLAKATFAPESVFKANLPNLLTRLVNAGDIQKASELARAFGWKGSLGKSGFAISKTSVDPNFSPLNWTAGTAPGLSSVIDRDGKVSFEVQPSQSGVVVQRFTAINSGKYNIRSTFENIGNGNVAISIAMRCFHDGKYKISEIKSFSFGSGNHLNIYAFSISNECPMQQWVLGASGFDIRMSNAVNLINISINDLK